MEKHVKFAKEEIWRLWEIEIEIVIAIAIVVRPKYLKSLMIMLSCSVIVHPRAYEQRSCTLILICRTYSVPRSVLARLSHLLLSFFLLCLWGSAGSVSPTRALLSMSGFDQLEKTTTSLVSTTGGPHQ